MSKTQTVVIGLDGAHFELLEPWIDDGHLPNLQHILRSGVSGDLEAVLPPVTSPNWKAYSTGKNPGKLGIFWWANIDVEGRRVHYPTSRKHDHTEFWEVIAEHDPVGVVNVPTTYPPKAVDSFLISGAPDSDDTGFTHPTDLESRLKEEFDYQVTKRHRIKDDKDAAVKEILDLIELRFSTAKKLLNERNISFLQVTTFYVNSLHHYFWDDEATLRAWKIIDDHLGDFLNDDRNVVLMSDHGSTSISVGFYINAWLQRNGYLKLDTAATGTLHRLGITADRLYRIAKALGLDEAALDWSPAFVRDYLPNEKGEFKREHIASHIDWKASDAIASGQGPVYLCVDESNARYEGLRTQIIDALSSLTDPDGRPIATAVHRAEDVYTGKYLNEAPDIIIDQAPGVHIEGGIGRGEVFFDPESNGWVAENKRTGLFCATGPSFARGTIADLSILDLAPTLLHLYGCPVPKDMDGEVRTSVFAPESDAATRDPTYSSQPLHHEEIESIRKIARTADL